MSAEAMEFLGRIAPLFGDERLQLCAAPPSGGLVAESFAPADVEGMRGFIAKHLTTHNLYFGQNSLRRTPKNGKAAETDIGHMLMLSADFDPSGPEKRDSEMADARKKLSAFPLKPSVVVDTGRGIQAFWFLRDRIHVNGNLPELKRYTEALARGHFGADSTFNLDRLMRLPGTTNHLSTTKRAKGFSEVSPTRIEEWSGERYALTDFDFLLRQEPAAAAPAAKALGRSETLLQRVGRCVRAGLADDEIHRLFDEHDPHAKDQSDPHRAVARAIKTAKSTQPKDAEPIVISMDAVEQKELEWLVPQFFPLGKLVIIAGDPGLGKSQLTLDIAAAITTQPRWPWVQAMSGDVLMLSAEDDPADTIKPRFLAAGGDPTRLHLLSAVVEIEGDGSTHPRPFSLLADIPRLVDAVRALDGRVRCVMIDPLSAYLGKTDSHKNAEVRAVLAPLSEFAATERVTVIAVSHLNKNSNDGSALYRISGSIGFVAASRASFLVSKDAEDEDRRIFTTGKMNLAKEGQGLAYRVREVNGVPKLEWEPGRVAKTANDALSSPKVERDREVEEWIADRLANGARAAVPMWDEARGLKFSEHRVKGALKRLRIKPYQDRQENGRPAWFWALPGPRRAGDQAGSLPPSGPLPSSGPLSGDQKSEEDQRVIEDQGPEWERL